MVLCLSFKFKSEENFKKKYVYINFLWISIALVSNSIVWLGNSLNSDIYPLWWRLGSKSPNSAKNTIELSKFNANV